VYKRLIWRSIHHEFCPHITFGVVWVGNQYLFCRCVCNVWVSRNSSVGMTTHYRLDGPGIKSRWDKFFRTRPDLPWGPHPASYTMGTGSFTGGKAAGVWLQAGRSGDQIPVGQVFPHLSRPALGPTPSLLYNVYRVFHRGVKRPGCGLDYPPPSSAEVKERVELYLYSTFGPSWPVPTLLVPL
jgi:hypothetical protein